jgi:DNA-binding LacI/PurR family transcriptional regulator/DNA-binding transcriptional regulator YhcF (GntR family)
MVVQRGVSRAQRQFREDLLHHIDSGKLMAGSRIQPFRVLSEKYSIGVPAIIEVVHQLQREGYVRTIRGSGTYVCERPDDKSPTTVALAIRTQGDVYAEFTGHLLGQLHQQDVIPRVAGLDSLHPYTNIRQVESTFNHLLSDTPSVLVLDSSASEERLPSQLYDYERRGGRIVQIFNEIGDFRFASHILPDYEDAICQATRHFIEEHDYDSVALLTRTRRPKEPARWSYTKLYHRGFYRALRTASRSVNGRRIRVCAAPNNERRMADIRRVLAGPKRPRAIVAERDHMANITLRVAAELGLRVPEDLAVCGIGDVPVAEQCELTTVRWNWNDMARQVVHEIANISTKPPTSRKVVRMTPELVVRSSCGCYANERTHKLEDAP